MRPRHIAVANRESRVVELSSLRLDATISRRRRPDEPFLHEGLCLFAGPADHLEGSLVQCVASLRLPSDPLLHRLEGHCGRLPGEDVDLIHRRHDVRFVEALIVTSASRIASAIPPSRSPPFVMRASSHFSAYSFAATSTSSR